MLYGELVKKGRIKRSLLQRELAAKLNIDSAYISKIEHNEKLPPKELALKIGKLLEEDLELVEVVWLKQKTLNLLIGEKFSLQALKLINEDLDVK